MRNLIVALMILPLLTLVGCDSQGVLTGGEPKRQDAQVQETVEKTARVYSEDGFMMRTDSSSAWKRKQSFRPSPGQMEFDAKPVGDQFQVEAPHYKLIPDEPQHITFVVNKEEVRLKSMSEYRLPPLPPGAN